MAKDRAAPFSRKHRKYWIPVTGGMILIGVINVGLGFCSYHEPPPTEPMEIDIPGEAPIAGSLRPAELPAAVMRAFAVKYPHMLPAGADLVSGNYVVIFPGDAGHKHATFRPDGTFVSED